MDRYVITGDMVGSFVRGQVVRAADLHAEDDQATIDRLIELGAIAPAPAAPEDKPAASSKPAHARTSHADH